jgi:hypothetical protein
LKAVIKDSFPWLWKLKELIDERPSLVPTGLGNNENEIDMDPFLPGFDPSFDDSNTRANSSFSDFDLALEEESVEEEIKQVLDEEDSQLAPKHGQKRKLDTEKKTSAHPGKSTPTLSAGSARQ